MLEECMCLYIRRRWWIQVHVNDHTMQYLSRGVSCSLLSECVAPGSCCPHAVARVNCRISVSFGRQSHTLMNTETTMPMLTSRRSLEVNNNKSAFLSNLKLWEWRWTSFVPGQCTVLQGSGSSLSPSQAESACVLLKCVSVWLQLRYRRLIPTSSTWLKHVLLHSDQLVHLLQTPSGNTAQEEDKVITVYMQGIYRTRILPWDLHFIIWRLNCYFSLSESLYT